MNIYYTIIAISLFAMIQRYKKFTTFLLFSRKNYKRYYQLIIIV